MTRRTHVAGDIETSYLDCGDGPACVVLHGFTGSATAMAPLVEPLSTSRRTLSIDLMGHGQSSAPSAISPYKLDAMVDRLAHLLASETTEPFDLVGYSMGGRTALTFAATHPKRVRRLVLISATAGLQSSEARRERNQTDSALADAIETNGLEAFVDEWENQPLFGTQQNLPPESKALIRAERLKSSPTGLANSLRGSGTGVMSPLWDDLPAIDIPTLIIAGALDAKYVEIGQRLSDSLPNSTFEVVVGVGHAVHMESPGACVALVGNFLDSP